MSRRVDALIEEINLHHGLVGSFRQQARAANRSMLEHAIAAGEALLAAKEAAGSFDRSGRGPAWLAWVKANTTVSVEMAPKYMRLAAYKDVLLATEACSIEAGIALLRGKPAYDGSSGSGPIGPEPEWWEAARALSEAGATQTEIACVIGVSSTAVRRAFKVKAPTGATRAGGGQRWTPRAQPSRVGAALEGSDGDAATMVRNLIGVLTEAHKASSNHEARHKYAVALTTLRSVWGMIHEAAKLDAQKERAPVFGPDDDDGDAEFRRQLVRSA